jgi:hypothetical protein
VADVVKSSVISSLVTHLTKDSVAPHINKDLTPYSVLMLYFASVFILLVERPRDITISAWTHLTVMDLVHYLTFLKLKCLYIWRLLFKRDMTYATAWQTIDQQLNSYLRLFMAKQ